MDSFSTSTSQATLEEWRTVFWIAFLAFMFTDSIYRIFIYFDIPFEVDDANPKNPTINSKEGTMDSDAAERSKLNPEKPAVKFREETIDLDAAAGRSELNPEKSAIKSGEETIDSDAAESSKLNPQKPAIKFREDTIDSDIAERSKL